MLPEPDNKALLAGTKPEDKPQSLSAPLMEYQQKVASLTDRVIALEEENAALQDIKNKLQTDFFSLTQEVAEKLLKSAHPELLESIDNLKQQVDELQKENVHLVTQAKQDKAISARLAESYDEGNEELQGRIEELEEQLRQQQEQFKKIQRSFEVLSEEKLSLEQENQALAAKLGKANADLLRQKQRVEVLSSQADSATQNNPASNRLAENKWAKEREALTDELLSAKGELEESESKYNALVQDFEESQAFYQGLKEELKNTTDELRRERDSNQKYLQSVEEELTKRARELCVLRESIQKLEEKNSESSSYFSKKTAEKEQEIQTLKRDYKEKIKEKDALIQAQHDEKDALQVIVNNRDDLITHLRGEIANLQQQVDTNKAKHAGMQRQVTALEKHLKDSQDELQASRHDFAGKIAEITSQKDAAEQKLETSERDLAQLNSKIEEADSNAQSDQRTIESLQQEKEKIEKDRDTYKLEASAHQQKIERLTAEYQQAFTEKDSEIASLTHQRAQLESAYQTQTQKSRAAQETIERLNDRVAQMETQQHEANSKLNVVEKDRQRLQQERDKLSTELDTAMEKLSQPAQTPLSQVQAKPARVQKRRHAISDSDSGLAEGESLAQQQERPLKIKRLSLAAESKTYGNDDESQTIEGRRNTMAGNAQTVIEQPEEPRILGDNDSTTSGISQVSTEDAVSASLTRQNTRSSDDSGVRHHDAEIPTVVPASDIMKKQKVDAILALLKPEIVINRLNEAASLGFLKELSKTKADDKAASNMLPILNQQVAALSNQHLATYKELLEGKLNDMPLSELEGIKVVDELLAIKSNSMTLKELAIQQGETYAKNYLNRFQAVAVAKTHKVFEEVARMVIADRQEALSLAIDAKTLAEKTIQNPAYKALESKLINQVTEIHHANPSDGQQAQARSQINAVFVANQSAIKSAIGETLAELEDKDKEEKAKQEKQAAITQLLEKIDPAQVSRALASHVRPILNELTEKGYSNTSIGKQLEQQLNVLTHSGLALEVAKKKLVTTLEENTLEQINTLGKQPDRMIEQLIHAPINPRNLVTQAKEIATKLVQQEIDSYQNKTAQDLENYYQSTHDFIKNAKDRLHLTMRDATSRELRDFAREDRNSLENLAELIKNGELDGKKQQLQAKLKEPELASEDEESYKQAIKSIEGIFQQAKNIPARIGVLSDIEIALNAIIAKNDRDSKQAIVKAQSSSHFFKVITTEEELPRAREEVVKWLFDKNNGIGSVEEEEADKFKPTHEVVEFNAGSTLIEAIRVDKKPSFLKKVGTFVKLGSLVEEEDHITLTYKAVKKDHIIEFSVDSANGDTRPSFIKKHIKNIDFVRSSTQSMLEAAQGMGEGRENKGLGRIILNTYDKNWKTRYALINAHAVLFPNQYMPRVYLEGKYTEDSLLSSKSLTSELEKLEAKFIKEYTTRAGSDEHVNGFNTQVKLFTPAP